MIRLGLQFRDRCGMVDTFLAWRSFFRCNIVCGRDAESRGVGGKPGKPRNGRRQRRCGDKGYVMRGEKV